MVNGAKFLVPLAGLIDKQAELERLTREIEKRRQNVAKLQGQLANEKFMAKAPEALISQHRNTLAQDEQVLATLEQQREKIARL